LTYLLDVVRERLAKLTDKKGRSPFLHTHHNWDYEVVDGASQALLDRPISSNSSSGKLETWIRIIGIPATDALA
jgi:hypothetical protein